MTQADPPHLAEAAARIAAAFRTLPDDAAVGAIAAHIDQFWAAPMRRGFLAIAPERLAPRLREAQKLVRAPIRCLSACFTSPAIPPPTITR